MTVCTFSHSRDGSEYFVQTLKELHLGPLVQVNLEQMRTRAHSSIRKMKVKEDNKPMWWVCTWVNLLDSCGCIYCTHVCEHMCASVYVCVCVCACVVCVSVCVHVWCVCVWCVCEYACVCVVLARPTRPKLHHDLPSQQ